MEVFKKRYLKWISTKTEVFENAFDQFERTKTEVFDMLQYPTMSFTKPEQCERTKTDIFGSVFVITQVNVNAQERMFFPPFSDKSRGAVYVIKDNELER